VTLTLPPCCARPSSGGAPTPGSWRTRTAGSGGPLPAQTSTPTSRSGPARTSRPRTSGPCGVRWRPPRAWPGPAPSERPRSGRGPSAVAMYDAAEVLGNTPSIARKSYVDPRVLDHYHEPAKPSIPSGLDSAEPNSARCSTARATWSRWPKAGEACLPRTTGARRQRRFRISDCALLELPRILIG
jgi:hypothetical protein